MNIEIIPAIMPTGIEDIKSKIGSVYDLVSTIQLDLTDGNFVPNQTWPYNGRDEYQLEQILSEEEGLPFWDKIDFEFDLMVSGAEKQFDTFVKLGAKRIVFHLEAEDNTNHSFKDFIEGIDVYDRESINIGIAISNDTDLEKIYPFINIVDFVQLMGIKKIGYQGEEFDDRVIERIKTLRNLYPDLPISIDGGVDIDTAESLVRAGATRLVVGSAIWKSVNPRGTVESLKNIS